MRIDTRTTRPALALLLALAMALGFAACGDETTAPQHTLPPPPECPDVPASATTFTVNANDWRFSAEYDSLHDRTEFRGEATVEGVTMSDVRMGQTRVVRLGLRGGLRCTQHVPGRILLFVEGNPGGWQSDCNALPSRYNGDWSGLHVYYARVYADGARQLYGMSAAIEADLQAKGETLDCVTFEWTIPANMNAGWPAGPGDIPINKVWFITWLDGDQHIRHPIEVVGR